MGADIHFVLETKTEAGKWLGIAWDRYTKTQAGNRWYQFFAELGYTGRAHAREPEELRGIPDDASELSQLAVLQWEGDGHSHSWLPYRDFRAAYVRALQAAKDDGFVYDPKQADNLFGWGSPGKDEGAKFRVVFFFDN